MRISSLLTNWLVKYLFLNAFQHSNPALHNSSFCNWLVFKHRGESLKTAVLCDKPLKAAKIFSVSAVCTLMAIWMLNAKCSVLLLVIMGSKLVCSLDNDLIGADWTCCQSYSPSLPLCVTVVNGASLKALLEVICCSKCWLICGPWPCLSVEG